MTSLRRFGSMQRFCMQLQDAANRTLKPFLKGIYYSPRAISTKYKEDTFNSMLRKQPPIVKQQHKEACKSNFCKQMEILLKNGIWIQNRYRKRQKQKLIIEKKQGIRRYKTPEFSKFRSSKNQMTFNEQEEQDIVNRSQHYTTFPIKQTMREMKNSHANQSSDLSLMKEYRAKLIQTQTENKRMKEKLQKSKEQNELLKQILNQSNKPSFKLSSNRQLHKKSRMREKRIKDLLEDIGVPLIQKSETLYSKPRMAETNYE